MSFWGAAPTPSATDQLPSGWRMARCGYTQATWRSPATAGIETVVTPSGAAATDAGELGAALTLASARAAGDKFDARSNTTVYDRGFWTPTSRAPFGETKAWTENTKGWPTTPVATILHGLAATLTPEAFASTGRISTFPMLAFTPCH